MKVRKPSPETSILIVVYGLVFLYFIFQEAIFTPDSYGYLRAMPQRNPGYVIFSKFFEFIFPNNYAKVIVGAQLLLGFTAIHIFFKRISNLLKLKSFLKVILLVCLLFPFFPPLMVANNICSEGLTYPLYLLFLAMAFELLYNEKKYTLFSLGILYLLLVLTRGQFLVTSLIFAFLYFLKYRSTILNKQFLWRLILLLLLPLIPILADKTYHKLKDGQFISTPYTFVNLSTAPFYVSNKKDVENIESAEYKQLFEACHDELAKKGLLLSSKKRDGYDAYYKHYHDNLPKICNQTFYAVSRTHYFAEYMETHTDEKEASIYSLTKSEIFCQSMFFALIKPNFNDWAGLYYSNIVHGFKSVFILLFVGIVFLFSTYKVLTKRYIYYDLLFICSALTLSNAMIISLASHSIMRYLFYNYVLIFLMIVIIFKVLTNAKRA